VIGCLEEGDGGILNLRKRRWCGRTGGCGFGMVEACGGVEVSLQSTELCMYVCTKYWIIPDTEYSVEVSQSRFVLLPS
jgi:hypothetical protein